MMMHVNNATLTCFFACRSERYLGTCHTGMGSHWWQSRLPEGGRLSVHASSSLFFPSPCVMRSLFNSHKVSKCGRSAGATCLQCRGLNATSSQMDGWLCDAQGPDKSSPTHQIMFAPPRSPTHQPSHPLLQSMDKKHRHTRHWRDQKYIFVLEHVMYFSDVVLRMIFGSTRELFLFSKCIYNELLHSLL